MKIQVVLKLESNQQAQRQLFVAHTALLALPTTSADLISQLFVRESSFDLVFRDLLEQIESSLAEVQASQVVVVAVGAEAEAVRWDYWVSCS